MLHWSAEAMLWDLLASNLEAGLPPDRSLALAADGAGGLPGRQARQAAEQVATGTPLAEALAGAGVVALACAVVRAGELSGRLPPLLRGLAEACRMRAKLRDETISRLAYPCFLLHLAPALLPLPWIIQGRLSAWCMLLGPLLLWALVGGVVLAGWWSGRAGILAQLVLRWPLGALARPALAADLAAVLRAALGAGMLAPDAIELAAGACANRVFAVRLAAAAADLRHRRAPDLHAALRSAGLGGDLLEVVRTGELSGRLEESLEQVRRLAAERFAWRLQWTARLLTGTASLLALLIAGAVVISMYWQVSVAPVNEILRELGN